MSNTNPQRPYYLRRFAAAGALMLATGWMAMSGASRLRQSSPPTARTSVDSGDKEITLTVTFPEIPGHEHPPGEDVLPHAIIADTTLQLPRDAVITSFHPRITNADAAVIHHGVLANLSEPDRICANTPYRTLFAFGPELTPIQFPEGYGIRARAQDPLLLQLMLHNPTPRTYRQTSIVLTIGYRRADTTAGRLEALVINAAGCEPTWQFRVPPNTEMIKQSPAVTHSEDLEIVAMGAHFHVGGQWLKVMAGEQELAEFRTLEDAASRRRIGALIAPGMLVRKGTPILVKTLYQNRSQHQIADAMGTAMLYVKTSIPGRAP